MGVISEAYIMRRLNDFIKSDAGKAKIAQVRKDLVGKSLGGGAGALSKDMAQEIINKICEEFKAVVREVIQSFRVDAIHANAEGFDGEGFLRANISVDEDALRRASLHYMNKDLTIGHGEGVDDILALFTHGYQLSKRPYGFWVRNSGNSMTRIGARMHRDPNPFLADFVDRLNAEYEGRCKAAIAEAEEIASGIEGVSMSANAGKDIDIKIDGANISEYVDNLKAAVDEYEERYKYNFGALSENAVYKYLKDSLTQAEESLNAQQSALKAFVEQTAAVTGDGLSIEFDESLTKAEAKEYYDTTVNTLLANIKADTDIATAIADGLFGDNADEAIREYAEEYIRKYHTELFNAANDIPVIVPLKSAIDIFDELDGEYSLLKDAMDEFNETGMVSAKTIRSMTDEFPDLLKYIRQTEEGFTLIDGTLDSIMADYWGMKAKEYEDNITAAYEYYVSVKNAYNHEADNALEQFEIVKSAYEQLQNAIESGENFITAFNVENDALLEEQYIQMLEEQKDAIEEQADAFSDLCDIRKELLKTYKEEKDYADELAKKRYQFLLYVLCIGESIRKGKSTKS